MFHAARKRVGDDERRRGQVVRLNLRMDAAFEVAIARKYRRDDERFIGPQRSRATSSGSGPLVADACGATVAHEIEAERVEILRETRALEQIIGNDFGAGCERSSSPMACADEAFFQRLFSRRSPAPINTRRIRRVRARRDRRDDDRAVAQLIGAADGGRAFRERQRLRPRPYRRRLLLRAGRPRTGADVIARGAPFFERRSRMRRLRVRAAARGLAGVSGSGEIRLDDRHDRVSSVRR